MKSTNELGTRGIDYILQSTHNQPVKVYLMMPSCVPATNMETSGATILADDIGCYLHQYPDSNYWFGRNDELSWCDSRR